MHQRENEETYSNDHLGTQGRGNLTKITSSWPFWLLRPPVLKNKNPRGFFLKTSYPVGFFAMKAALTFVTTALVSITVEAHSNLIYPKPRNAIDSNDPRWSGGKSPDQWNDRWNEDKRPCACRNGTDICDIGQTCLWMGVGCSIGCKECDGGIINGTPVGANPNSIDRCGSGMKATINDPLHRTTNRYESIYCPWQAVFLHTKLKVIDSLPVFITRTDSI